MSRMAPDSEIVCWGCDSLGRMVSLHSSGYSHIIFFMSAYKKQLNRQQSARLDTHAHVENTVIISVGAAVDAFAAILVALPARK